MITREDSLKNYKNNSQKALEILKSNGFSIIDIDIIWQILIYELDHFDIPTQVLFHNLSVNEIVTLINEYLNKNGIPIKKIALRDSIIPDELNNDLIKAQIKFKGEIWTIHKNDKDTFPSQPHAHNYGRQYKLHLGNGKLYRKNNCMGKISSKDFLYLRQIILKQVKNINLPQYEND